MSKNNTKLLDAKHNSVNRKRLYKSKGQWKVYGVSTMALGAAFVGLTYQTTDAHADALSDLQASTSTTSANSSNNLNNAASNVNSAINAANTTVANQANSVDSNTAVQTSPATALSSHTASAITVDANKQAGNMSATQAVNSAIDTTVNQYKSANSAVGGSFVKGQSNNVASQTGSQIVSDGQNTVNKLNVVGSANQLINDTINSASGITSKVGGTTTAGSTINATNLTPQQISSVAQTGRDMLSVTGSANQTLGSTINANISNLNASGASLYKGLSVNTADNMTVSDVRSNLSNQLVNLSTVGSANQVIATARSSNSASVKAVNGVLNAGSAIDATSMTPDQIISLMTKQATMLSATGSADAQITNAVNSNSGFILSAGGNLTQTGNYNTANNMTPSDITSLLNAQLQNISATGSAATQISSTNAYNNPLITGAGGKVTTGSAIDVTGMSPEVISAITASLNSNVSLVGSADTVIRSAVGSAYPATSTAGGVLSAGSAIDASKFTPSQIMSILAKQSTMLSATANANQVTLSAVSTNNVPTNLLGGTITQSGTFNTANNMTVSQVQDLLNSQTSNLNQVGSGNAAILSALSAVKLPVSNAFGTLSAGSTINATSFTADQIASLITKQTTMLSATGSADSAIVSGVNYFSPAILNNGGTVSLAANINTANNMTSDQVASTVLSQLANLSQTASANQTLSAGVASNKSDVQYAQGSLIPGSALDMTAMTPQQIASLVAKQSAMVWATGSADKALMSTVNDAGSQINAAGGSLTLSGSFNTADNMNPSLIASTLGSQMNRINLTASGDRVISSTVASNQPAISALNSGSTIPGSAIDTTNMTLSDIASIIAHQSLMVTTTGWADSTVSSAIVANGSNMALNGGKITNAGSINTADNMTPDQIISLVNAQTINLSNTAIANSLVNNAVVNNTNPVSTANGVLAAGSAIDTTNMTPSQIQSIAAHQSAMVNVTGSADSGMTSTLSQYNSMFTVNGGSMIFAGTVNTADNMTVSDVVSHYLSQSTHIATVASDNVLISTAVSANQPAISNITGVTTPGSAIDVTNLSYDQLASLVYKQSTMVSATGSADNSLVDILNSVSPDITAIGGSLYNGSKINTANNMTPDQILSTIQSQNDKLSQTASGDIVISQTVSDAKPSISAINGITTPGSTINTDNLTASQLDSIVNQQSTMVSTTASADSGLLSAIQSNSADMMMNGGQLFSGSTFNTADNWTPEKISSTLLSQSKTMSATAVGDFNIWSAMDANSDQVSYASGVLKPGSTLDTEHMTLSQIFSIMNQQMTMLSATGSADSDLMSNVDSATVNFTDNGGTLKLASTVNTADNWNPSQISSHVASQDTQISLTASGNIVISNVVSNNADAIGSAGAVYTPGSALDVTKLTASQLQSIVAHQYSMVSATGSADADIQPIVDSTAASFEQNQATLVNGGTINTASNMTVSQIDSYEKSQSAKISQTVDANNAIYSALVNNQDQISVASGVATYGSAIDTTKLTTSQINSIVSHQSQMLSVTGWADSDMTSNVNSNQDDIVNAGGSLTQISNINTANNWSAASVVSYEKSQGSAMSFTASADRVIASFVAANQDAINNANGTLAPGSAVNVNSMSSFEIQRWTSEMNAMVNATGSADSYLVSARDSAMPSIVSNFGDIRQSGNVNTADNMSPIEVSNHVASQVKKISATASGDSLIYQALSQNSQTISDFYGVAEAGSVIDTTNLTSSQIRSIASQQSSMVSVTGSADSNIHSISDWATSSINFNSGTISQGSTINTADNWTVSQVLSHMNSQNAIISQTGSGDYVIGTVVQSAANPISNFSGVSSYGSDIDTTHLTSSQIRSITSKQYSMVSVTASADMDIQSTRDSAAPGISMNNGVIYQSGTVNTADNWTVGSVLSHMRSQHPIISATASADIMIANALSQNSQKVLDFLGTMTYGSNIDTTHLTLSQVRSIASQQSSMISVTASADTNVKSASDTQTNNINNNNGVIAQSGTVNTADNWTVGEVLSHMQSQNLKINATGSADSMIYQALSQNSAKVSNFSGVMTYGSALNTNNLTLAQIQSIASAQSSMISVTGSADDNIHSLVDYATPSIAFNNGTLTLSSTVNTADNWTVGEVLNHMQSQHSIINATASADILIGTALSQNSASVSAFSGIMTYGSNIDTTHLTSLQIRSLASAQSSMISVTATADTNVKAASDAQTTNITNNNGVIVRSGTINTADNWTVGDVLIHMTSQSLKINATGSADSLIYQALSQNSATVSNFSGVMTYGSALNTNNLTLDQLHSIASAQSSMISVTASADDNIHSLRDATAPAITANQGTIVQSGTVNTADSWTVNQVLSHMASQHVMIDATASADAVISRAITQTSGSIFGLNGIMQYGSAIDTTHLTSLQVRSIASEQSSMISVTGSADDNIHSIRDANTNAIQANGGTIVQSGNVNTADNWTVNEVLSHMASQHENISAVGSADIVISGAIAANSAKIANASAVYAPASPINATSLTSQQIESIAYKQSTMVSATGSADDALMNHVSMDTPQIQQAGAYLSHTSNINTADNMNPSQIASILSAQSSNMDAVASADLAVTNNRSGNDALSKPFNGGIYVGGNSVADATNWTVSDIYSNGSSQVRWMSLTASDNVFLSSTQTIAQSKANKLGATLQQGSALDITNGLTYDQVQSITASQAATLSATGNGDDNIWSALSVNVASINAAGGSMNYLGQSNAAFRPQSYVDAYASSQVENIVHTGQADEALSLTASDASDVLQRYGGGLNRNNVIDVSGSNGSQIDVIASSNVARMSAAKSATLKVSNAEQTYATMITNIGGTAQKGATTDVTSLTPDQITPIVDRQVSVLSATGVGDVMLSNAVASANGLTNRVGGTINRGADINTANMDVTDILSQASHQADNITRVGSANATIFSGLSQFSQQINSPQGSIIMVAPSDATNGQPGDMESYANSQYNNLSYVASADSYLGSRVSNDVKSTTINGATMTSAAAIDGTNMTGAQLASFVQSQTDRLDAVALANSDIRSQINTGSSGAVVNGGVIDVTGWMPSAIQSNEYSQVSHISATQHARSTIYSALSDTTSDIYAIGASIGDRGSIDTTNKNAADAISMADSDAFRLSYVASNDSLIASASIAYTLGIRKASGAITAGANFNMTDWNRVDISSVAQSEVKNMSAVASANTKIESAANEARTAKPRTSVTIVGSVNADGWKIGDIASYGASVTGVIATVSKANYEVSMASQRASNFGLQERSDGSTVIVSTQEQANSLSQSNLLQESSASARVWSAYSSALDWIQRQTTTAHTGDAGTMLPVYDGSSDKLGIEKQQNIAIGVYPSPSDDPNDYEINKATADAGISTSGKPADIKVIAPNLDDDHIIKNIQWDPGQMQPYGFKGMEPRGGGHMNAQDGGSVTLPNAVTTMSGKHLDLELTFHGGGQFYNQTDGIMISLDGHNSIGVGANTLDHWDQRANGGKGGNVHGYNDTYVGVDAKIVDNDHILNTTTNINYDKQRFLYGMIAADIDTDQTFSWSSDLKLVAIGGKIAFNSPNNDPRGVHPASGNNQVVGDLDQQSGYQAWDANGNTDGLIALASYGNGFSMQIQNSIDNPQEDGIYQSFFGNAWDLSKSLYRQSFTVTKGDVETKSLSTQYHPLDVDVYKNYQYTYNPLSTTYQAVNTNVSPISSSYNVLSDVGGYTPFTTGYNPLISSYHSLSNIGGYNPQVYGTTPIATTYQSFSSDGTHIPPQNPDGTPNDKFTGYSPISTTYKNYSTDGTKVNPYNPDGTLNNKFTGYTPLSVTYMNYSSDGNAVNPYNPDGSLNPNFTGYTPLSMTYQNYSSDGASVKVFNPDGTINPKFTGYTPLSSTYMNYSSDGAKVNPYNPDGTLNQNFTGFTPLSLTYQNYSSDGAAVKVFNPDGTLNKGFTGYTPLDVTYMNYSSDGTKVNPYNPDGTLNDKFTGYTPLSVTYNNYSTDGQKVNPYNPDGTLNPKFTGYTPLSITYKNYSSDGTGMQTTITNENGKQIPNPKFTGYVPLSYQYSNFSSDGEKVNPYNPDGTLNKNFTGYTPLNTTYKTFSTDGSKVNPYLADGRLNPRFTGYTPLSMTYTNYSSDGSKVNPYNRDGTLNPKFTGYTPLSMTYHNYSTDGAKVNPYNPDGTLNNKFTGYTPLSGTYHPYSTDGQNIPTMITDQNGNKIPNPAFTGYSPLNVQYQTYSSDGTKVNPYNSDGSLNPKYTGYTPLNTTYKNFVTDGSNIPSTIKDSNGNTILNPAFTGYTPLSTTYKSYTSDGSKVPSTIKDSNGNTIPNPAFTGYTPFSTTYKNYSSDGSKIPTTVTTSDGKVIPNPEFTGYAPISTTYKAFSSDGSKIAPTITDANGNTIPNPEFTGFAPISTTTHAVSTSYKGFESDGTQVNPYNPDGSLNPKFTGFTPINTTYHPYSSDGKNILTVLPNGEINPEFTGYVPFSTDYSKDKTIYHYYSPDSLKPVNPNGENGNGKHNNGNGNGNSDNNGKGKYHNPDDLNPKKPNKGKGNDNGGSGNSNDNNGNGTNFNHKNKSNTHGKHKRPIRPNVNGNYHNPNNQGQNNRVVIPNRNTNIGNGNDGSGYGNNGNGYGMTGNGNGAGNGAGNGNGNNANGLGNNGNGYGNNNNGYGYNNGANNGLIGGSQQATLPQTGAEKQALALLGFASLTTAFGLALVGKKRKKDGTK